MRCIVSVGMLTEGWDCNTVTHVVGLRPFMSQLLCEQVVGRALRRTNYDVGEDGKLEEEVAKVFGVPFEVVPFRSGGGTGTPRPRKHHVRAIPEKAHLAIIFPRVEGYQQAIKRKLLVDWDALAPTRLDASRIPPQVDLGRYIAGTGGPRTTNIPGGLETVSLAQFRADLRDQQLAFALARELTRRYRENSPDSAATHILFPQILHVVERYIAEKVEPGANTVRVDAFISPYWDQIVTSLVQAIKPDESLGENPELPVLEKNRSSGSTSEVSFWTSRDVREVQKSHLNFIVADTAQWEQSAAYTIDTHPVTAAFVNNAGLGFAIPYLHNGEPHEYIPDFVIRLTGADDQFLILETKGHDDLADVKAQAAQRWVAAVNAAKFLGTWRFVMACKLSAVTEALNSVASVGAHA